MISDEERASIERSIKKVKDQLSQKRKQLLSELPPGHKNLLWLNQIEKEINSYCDAIYTQFKYPTLVDYQTAKMGQQLENKYLKEIERI